MLGGRHFVLVWESLCDEGRQSVVTEPRVGVDARWTAYLGDPLYFHAA